LSRAPKDCVIGSGGVSFQREGCMGRKLETNLQASTFKFDETGEPLRIQ